MLAALCINFIRAQKCTAQIERESNNKICDKYIGNFTQHPAVLVCLCQFQYYVEFVRIRVFQKNTSSRKLKVQPTKH